MQYVIEEWPATHPNQADLQRVIAGLAQDDWVAFDAPWHRSSHMLVASAGPQVLGFLRFVVQEIGIEDDRPAVMFASRPLLEAKVIAFGVVATERRKGVGRALQVALLTRAKALGCYQVRSHSSGSNLENHQLKLAMGFAVQPIVRDADQQGAYFIKVLQDP